MKLVTLNQNGVLSLGVKIDEGIVDVAAALLEQPNKEIGDASVMNIINGGKAAVQGLEAYIQQLPLADQPSYLLNEDDVVWGPCVTQPSKIICVGLNYRKHAEETNSPIPQYPILFNKFSNTLAAHQQEIAVPKVTEKLDYEVELAIVIGEKAKYVSKEQALNYVFGYCTVNDLSARDLQMRTPQWLLGKSCDHFSPLGPYLVTAEEVGNPNQLVLKTTVNGETRQNSNTSDMIFHCDEIVSYISQHMTLEPGDVILTGTPEGVVIGYPPEKQVYLKAGDEVSVTIEKLGTLTNRFIAEK